jgi:hypothetical protein
MTLTRKERESLVIDLLNKCTPIREIASRAGLSFREIGAIKKKEMIEKETKEGQAQQMYLSTHAYKLFSDGKSPIQVVVALNLREPEVAKFYVEYWKLSQLHSLNWVYEQVKDNIGYFVSLYIAAKVARMDVQHVIRLLEIANKDLPAVELRYERLKREAATLEYDRANSVRDFQQLNEHIIMMRKTRDSIHLDYEKGMERLRHLQQQRMKQEALVKHFENNNEEYTKIKNTVEEKVHSILSDQRMVLKLALLSLTVSMKNDPDKYSSLIYCNASPSTTPATDYAIVFPGGKL